MLPQCLRFAPPPIFAPDGSNTSIGVFLLGAPRLTVRYDTGEIPYFSVVHWKLPERPRRRWIESHARVMERLIHVAMPQNPFHHTRYGELAVCEDGDDDGCVNGTKVVRFWCLSSLIGVYC